MLRIVLFWLVFWLPLGAIEHIERYELFVKQYQEGNKLLLISRRFELSGVTFYLTTDTHTLHTKVLTLDASKLTPLDARYYATPFAQILKYTTVLDTKGGATHAMTPKGNALYLTMDFCPSLKKGYESAFIETLTTQNGKTPVALAMSSAWIEHHQHEFDSLVHNPRLEITWINHTHTHFYDPHLPNSNNFMLHVNTDVKKEILELEKTLLERGLTPSVFFRFPGLIADKTLMKELRETYFLIPLSADAWIAKNQPIKQGSFILVHGNKNEHQGIEMLEKKLPEVLKTYRFHSLQEAFVK